MKHLLLSILIAFVLCIAIKANAQSNSNGNISLKVSDEQQKPVDGVFVELVLAKDSSMAQFAITDKDGVLAFVNVKQGNYIVYISQAGYENYYSPVVSVDDSHLQITLSQVELKAKSLNEVTVIGKTPVIQHYADRTVLNVQQSILISVGNIFDLLQRSPGITVDANDNISMQGKSGITVMINNRPTSMSGEDLANLLRGISADAVDKVELITNPSAKYDANGTAGIINIILKKDRRMGTNVTINVGHGQGVHFKNSDGFTFNTREKSFNIFMNYNFADDENFHIAPRTRSFYNGAELTGGYSENDDHVIPYLSHSARIGVDFFLSKNTTIGIVGDGTDRVYSVTGVTTANVFDSATNPLSYNITNSDIVSKAYNYSGNFNLNHKFDSTGREILVNVDYATYTSHTTQSFATDYYNLNNSLVGAPYLLYGDVPGQLNIYSFKADYDGAIGENGKLEAGIKTSYVKTDNNLAFYDGADAYAPKDTGQSNHFIYSENINALYASYYQGWRKVSVQLGLRAEQTIANGDQVTTNQLLHINSLQFFPNIDFNDSVSQNSQVSISFSRRLDRPTYQQLNPFRNYVDPSTYAEGNPLLLPQYAYSLQLSETYKQNYNISLSYTRTTGIISSVWMPTLTSQKEPIIAEKQVNLDYNEYYGSNASIIIQITGWWTATNIFNAYYTHYNANYLQANLNTTKFYWDAGTDNVFALKNKLSIDVNFNYSSGWDDGYLYQTPSENLSIGVQKKILNGKGVIKLNATDIFYTSNGKGTATFTNYVENFYIQRDTRVVSLAFSYHFGGNVQSRSMRSKGGAEEEKKRAGGSS